MLAKKSTQVLEFFLIKVFNSDSLQIGMEPDI